MQVSKKTLTYILIIFLIIGTGVAAWMHSSQELSTEPEATTQNQLKVLKVNDQCVTLAVSDTKKERNLGLSTRDDLPDNQGMLFLFDRSGKHGFWMKDMNFSIDIIWLDENNRVVYVEQSISPETYPKTFEPAKNAKKVVELNAGFVNQENINRGETLKISNGTSASSSDCGVFYGS